MPARPLPSLRRALFVCAFAAATALMCAALVSVAALVPAPPAALPGIILLCVGCPVAAAHELPPSLVTLRREAAGLLGGRALARLRRDLSRLPETEHPLGL